MTLTAAAAPPTTRIDLMSAALAADPWPSLRALQALGPVVWHETYGRWIVTTDREVRAIAADFRRFTVEGTTMADLFGTDAFISMDDRARHDPLRFVWAEPFRRPGLEALRPRVLELVDELIGDVAERMHAGEAIDVAAALCRPLPTLVIALMMGVPKAMLADVVRWTDDMAATGTAYLDKAAVEAAIRRREAAKTELADYLIALLVARRAQPADDLVSMMVHSDAARGLADHQIVQNVRQLLFAGNETTAKWLGHIFVTYGENPEVQRDLGADRSLVVAANDEVMRWQTVVGTLIRNVRGGPVELAGVTLAEGDEITCVAAAANRDPARFADPDRFDIRRPPAPIMGFGVGLHHCLGINLAKLEAEVLINRVLDELPPFAVAAPYTYSSLPLRGPLPVTIARA